MRKISRNRQSPNHSPTIRFELHETDPHARVIVMTKRSRGEADKEDNAFATSAMCHVTSLSSRAFNRVSAFEHRNERKRTRGCTSAGRTRRRCIYSPAQNTRNANALASIIRGIVGNANSEARCDPAEIAEEDLCVVGHPCVCVSYDTSEPASLHDNARILLARRIHTSIYKTDEHAHARTYVRMYMYTHGLTLE